MGYFRKTCRAVRQEINARFPFVVASEKALPGSEPYILWMVDEIERMDRTLLKAAMKANRWIGWVLRAAEERMLWNNEFSRNIIRQDVKARNDRPRKSRKKRR